ncbi:MAG: hypothetical protein PQJ28_01295 [Spirochaetales bacterium]|nr:hypothetical protein [Spirochaetales bacterium]
MAKTLERHIERYFLESERLSKQKLVTSIKEDFPLWSDNTINMYLSKLKKEGKISTPSKGIYELGSISLFSPEVSSSLKKIYNKIKREFPYITFCVWDSAWLNDLMQHQPFRYYMVVEVEKEASEPVFGFLSETITNVFLNPGEEIFNRYIQNLDEVVIVKKLVSEAPLMETQKIVIPALEKLLVDMLTDTNLFSAQQNETDFIMNTAIEKFAINELKMKRYALRRNRESEVKKLINISLAKKQ